MIVPRGHEFTAHTPGGKGKYGVVALDAVEKDVLPIIPNE